MNTQCCKCEHAAIRQVAINGYCRPHLRELFSTFQHIGVGIPVADDDLLQCCRCDATWRGPFADICRWCENSHNTHIAEQASLVLVPPDLHVDLNDPERKQAIAAWVKRLRHATKANIITKQQAVAARKRIE